MNKKLWNVGVIGVTGAVGRTMVRCLSEIDFPLASVRGFASPRSEGTRLALAGRWGQDLEVELLTDERLQGLDLVLLSAGSDVSRLWVPRLATGRTWVVDNSSAYRMDPEVPLIVPEVNGDALPGERGPIANPNCSTIQMVVVLAPLLRRFGLRRVHVATYQSVSGIGQKGITAWENERTGGQPGEPFFGHRIDRNVIPQCADFSEDGFTREEEKMIEETRRILGAPDLKVHPTCARVPVEIGHSEAIHVELAQPASRAALRACLAEAPGVRLHDDPGRGIYPTARAVAGDNEVWVGRVRQDRTDPKIAEVWVVADNLRKGAAWNAVQIALALHERER